MLQQKYFLSYEAHTSVRSSVINEVLNYNFLFKIFTLNTYNINMSKRKSRSSTYGEVLDSCDSLRTLTTLNIDNMVNLKVNDMVSKMIPTIVVVGDQSCGKSSLISAIAGIPIPTGSSRTTSCRCEIRLRKGEQSQKIWIEDVNGNLVHMGVYTEESFTLAHNQIIEDSNGSGTIFNRNYKIVLEIKSETTTDMTLIDLPGLFCGNNQFMAVEQAIVESMVLEYTNKPNSVVVHVISVADDISGKMSRNACNTIDPQKTRTITVFTKADKAKITQEARAFALEEVSDKHMGIFVQMREAVNDTWIELSENSEDFIWGAEEWTNFQLKYPNIYYGRKNFKRLLEEKLESMIKKESNNIINCLEEITKVLDNKLTNGIGRYSEKPYQIYTKWCTLVHVKSDVFFNNGDFRKNLRNMYTSLNSIIPEIYPLSLRLDVIAKEEEEIRGDSLPFVTGCEKVLMKYTKEAIEHVKINLDNWMDDFFRQLQFLIASVYNNNEITPNSCRDASTSLVLENNEKLNELKNVTISKINMTLSEVHKRPFVSDNNKFAKAIKLSRSERFVKFMESNLGDIDRMKKMLEDYNEIGETEETIIKIREYWKMSSLNLKEVIMREFRTLETMIMENIKESIEGCDITLIKEPSDLQEERNKLLKAESIAHDSLYVFKNFV